MRRKKRPVQRLKNNISLRKNAEARLERYRLGLNEGFRQGLQAGMENYEAYFNGTSIIIPSENQLESLKACIEGIMKQTDLPYEIIVVDNGSTDGTEQYLKKLNGQVRYCSLLESCGITGAANRGFMMAKGTTILLLSSEICPTASWLDNLLLCLHSKTSIGLVGPVSNGFNDSQRVEFHYEDLEDMHEIARVNNKSNCSKWHEEEYLSYGCLLFRRELLERVGYLDEGCQNATLSVQDYGTRVRLLGYSLVIARDVYVHASVRLANAAELISSNSYFRNKWSGLKEVLSDMDAFAKVRQALLGGSQEEALSGEAVFYPQGVVVKGLESSIYWIEGRIRRPIAGVWEHPVIPLSQLDLWRWIIGEPIAAAYLQKQLHMLSSNERESIERGRLCMSPNGDSYYLENGRKRALVSPFAAECWGLDPLHRMILSDEELRTIPDGLPIIAPIKLHQAL
jgi:GT2 family glycosyltransferase